MYLVRLQGVQAADGVQGLVERCCYPIRLPTVPRFKWNDRGVWTWDGWTMLDKKIIYLQWYIYICIHICHYMTWYLWDVYMWYVWYVYNHVCIYIYRHLNHTWHIMLGLLSTKKPATPHNGSNSGQFEPGMNASWKSTGVFLVRVPLQQFGIKFPKARSCSMVGNFHKWFLHLHFDILSN